MKHGVAVWTYGPQVFDRVQLVVRSKRGQRNHVVDMNKPGAKSAVSLLKSQSTDDAGESVVGDTRLAGCTVSFIGVHQNLSDRTFTIFPASDLFRTLDRSFGLVMCNIESP